MLALLSSKMIAEIGASSYAAAGDVVSGAKGAFSRNVQAYNVKKCSSMYSSSTRRAHALGGSDNVGVG